MEIFSQGISKEKDMTPIQAESGKKEKRYFNSRTKKQLTIDMTPMVDLGFLLIAFFIITTELTKPAITKLFMPHDGVSMHVGNSRSLTILADQRQKIFYYFDTEEQAIKTGEIFQTSFSESGIGEVIRKKQFSLGPARDSLVVLIKPGKNSVYKNVVDLLDEMLINGVKRYSLADISTTEQAWIDRH